MGQRRLLAALAYGREEAEKIRGLIRDPIPIIDMTLPNWAQEIPVGEDGSLLTISPHTHLLARRSLPEGRFVSSVPDTTPPADEEKGGIREATVNNDIAISPTATAETKRASIWLSPYHLKLIERLFRGHRIEFLDEDGRVVETIGGEP